MFEYYIRKYESLMNSDGRMIDEWTCPSEIGSKVGGLVLTADEYLATEAKYVAAAMDILNQSGLSHLRVCGLNHFGEHVHGEHYVDSPAEDLSGDPLPRTTLSEDMIVPVADVPTFLRLTLRPWNEVSFTLEIAARFYVMFGYDFQMWIGTEVQPTLDKIRETGLYVDEGRPNTRADDGPWRIVWSHPAPEDPIVLVEVGECVVDLDRAKIQTIFGWSHEHPAQDCRRIQPSHAERFRQFVDVDFRFEEFNYELINDSF